MKSNLAIAALIQSRMIELSLSRGVLAKRLGYKNIAKGIRRIEALSKGDLDRTKQILDLLPHALETSDEIVKLALDRTVRDLELTKKRDTEAQIRSGGRIFVHMRSSSRSRQCQARFSLLR